MRQERTVQASLFDLFAGHEIGRELKAMSQWLDEDRELIGPVAEDLRRHGVKETGRQGLSAESVLRCGLLKQHRQLSYEELAFHLEDSASFRAFARLPLSWTPKKSVLHMTISAIRAETWEAINRILLASARQEKVETGKVVRLDSTVTAALLHEPSDSSLLWDAVLRDRDLLLVEDLFRRTKAIMRTRPIFHSSDAAIRGHVFCSFLALSMQKHLDDLARQAGLAPEWKELLRDLDRLQQVRIHYRAADWLVRTDAAPDVTRLFKCAHVALPSRARQARPPPPLRSKSARKRRGRPRCSATPT